MRFFLSFIFILAIPALSVAQKETNHWIFGGEQFNPFTAGNSMHLDFNSGQPVIKTDSRVFSRESAASISDANGNLLFYTNGIEVFNAQHDTMPNGFDLKSSTSTTQGSIIVPHPGNSNLYFVFSLTLQAQQDGLHYSIVDMREDNGKGDVVLKNKKLKSTLTEKMAAVHHANGKDFWLMVHGYQNNEFYAYKIDENGVNETPVVSAVGPKMGLVPLDLNATLGNMKFSHCGHFLACAMYSLQSVDFYRFDNATGVLCDHIKITSPDERLNFNQVYGLEWSPDDSKVYAGTYQGGQIFQFSLTNYNKTAITNSLTDMGDCGCTTMGDLQLAPDGKIYVTYEFGQFLGVIENPNDNVPAAKYTRNGLEKDSTQALRLALPDFVSSMVHKGNCRHPNSNQEQFLGPDTVLCSGSSLILDATHSGATYLWSDGSTESTLEVSASGTFWVEVNISECIRKRDTIDVIFENFTIPEIRPSDTLICEGDEVILEAGIGLPATYRWQDGSVDSNIVASVEGTYWVEITSGLCSSRDTITIGYVPKLMHEALTDVVACSGENAGVSLKVSNATVTWQDSIKGVSRLFNQEGVYRYRVQNACESIADSVRISFRNCDCYVHVPNAFTPNHDDINEVLKPVIHCDLYRYEMLIFNRWGELLFRTDDPEAGWDGTYKGVPCLSGAYMLILDAQSENFSTQKGYMIYLLEGEIKTL